MIRLSIILTLLFALAPFDAAFAQLAGTGDFRIVWEAVAGALAQRDKVLVDGDSFEGRLWLFDTDFIRGMFPGMLPSSRGLGARSSREKGSEKGP